MIAERAMPISKQGSEMPNKIIMAPIAIITGKTIGNSHSARLPSCAPRSTTAIMAST
jgi:hypothetical protein